MSNRQPTKNQVLAATAGLRPAWEWELLDYLHLVPRFIFRVPPPTECPICLETPDEASSSDEWYYTITGCGHAFCLECFRDHAAHQVRDPDHHGALQCPQCFLPVKEADAVVALAHDPVTLQVMDQKMRDVHLRAAESFRQCPHCFGGGASEGVLGRVSGGFVTRDCLNLNEDRQIATKKLLKKTGGLVLCFKLYVFLGVASLDFAPFPVKRVALTILSMTWFVWVCIEKMQLQEARKVWFQQMVVECPCCAGSFMLNAEAELSGQGDDSSKDWIQKNSRPCPKCFVPITKNGGCNHMKCTSCGADFRWNNAGAPFGNTQYGAVDPFTQYKDRPLSIGLDVATLVLLLCLG